MTMLVPRSPMAFPPVIRIKGGSRDARPTFIDLLRAGPVKLRPLSPPSPRLRRSMNDLTLALDRAISQREYTPDGHLRIASTVLTRAEPSPYRGSDIPDYQSLGLDPERTYWLLRDPGALRRRSRLSSKFRC